MKITIGSIEISTTVEQDDALQFLVDEAKDPDLETYISRRVMELLGRYAQQSIESRANVIRTQFIAGSKEARDMLASTMETIAMNEQAAAYAKKQADADAASALEAAAQLSSKEAVGGSQIETPTP